MSSLEVEQPQVDAGSRAPTRRQRRIDAITATLGAFVAVWISEPVIFDVDPRVSAVVAALGVLPLAVRRSRPVESAAAVFAVGAVQVVVGWGILVPANLAVLVALYSVTMYGPRWASRTAIGGVLIGSGLVGLRILLDADGVRSVGLLEASIVAGGIVATLALLGLLTWVYALLLRSRRQTLAALRDRAARLERERDQQARLAAVAERTRIAREMHDVVAHSLSVVIAQADGGRYAVERDPEVAAEVLDTIAQTGRSALADIRRILGVLRTEPTLRPQPTSEDLDQLIDRVRGAGLEVVVEDEGQARPLPSGLELTVYRVCQEALTNVLKHAGPAATVAIRRCWTDDELQLEVVDDGRGSAAARPDENGGHGLDGMRERVALYDGTLRAGPRPGGGFVVQVTLPVPTAAAAGSTASTRTARSSS